MWSRSGRVAAAVVSAAALWRRPVWWLLVPVALVAGALPSFSVGMTVLVLVVGAPMFCLGVARTAEPAAPLAPAAPAEPAPPGRSGPGCEGGRRPAGSRWWLVPLTGLVAVEAATLLLGSTPEHPTLSLLADPWLERYPVRGGAFLLWTAAFWALVRR